MFYVTDASSILLKGYFTPPAFKDMCHRVNGGFFWGTWTLCAAACVTVAQCHLVKSAGRKYFYRLPKSRLAGKFQMCLHEQAVRSRWCLSPVLNVPREHWGLYAPLRASPYQTGGSVLCSWKTLWICQPIQ